MIPSTFFRKYICISFSLFTVQTNTLLLFCLACVSNRLLIEKSSKTIKSADVFGKFPILSANMMPVSSVGQLVLFFR